MRLDQSRVNCRNTKEHSYRDFTLIINPSHPNASAVKLFPEFNGRPSPDGGKKSNDNAMQMVER